MIDQHGGFEAVRNRYLRLENPPLMRLVIEVIGGPYPNGAYVYRRLDDKSYHQV